MIGAALGALPAWLSTNFIVEASFLLFGGEFVERSGMLCPMSYSQRVRGHL